MTYKIKIKKTCRVCNTPLKHRQRVFCSKTCRYKNYGQKYKKYRKEWQQKKRGEYKPGKLQCLICGRWYVQIGSHVFQYHKLTARQYREEFDLPLKKGITPKWYEKLKGRQAIENKTYKNLLGGKKYRYKKGDKRAKIMTGWKGRKGSMGYKHDNYY